MIEVGEFVRTKEGCICKMNKLDISGDFTNINDINAPTIQISHILKHSKNIIDLIEVGDYVNGQLIEKIYKKENDRIYYEFLEHEDGSFEIMEMCELKNIKSIVTSEQFKSIEYRLEEK